MNDDWVDPELFGHFVELLSETDPDKVFLYYNLGGQDCIIGCVMRQQFVELRKRVPKFEPLT